MDVVNARSTHGTHDLHNFRTKSLQDVGVCAKEIHCECERASDGVSSGDEDVQNLVMKDLRVCK